jgi:hypothetical protein
MWGPPPGAKHTARGLAPWRQRQPRRGQPGMPTVPCAPLLPPPSDTHTHTHTHAHTHTHRFSLVGAYMRKAFPAAAAAAAAAGGDASGDASGSGRRSSNSSSSGIVLRNGALPATPSALMNMCLEQYVDAEVDLVFVEYVANDGSNRCVVACVCGVSRARAAQWPHSACRACMRGVRHEPAAPPRLHARSWHASRDTPPPPGLTRSRRKCMSACCASCSTTSTGQQSCSCS